MALKRQHTQMSMFSMASMTDVIFLLLIFFMVTSTFVFPSALEVNLPQSSEQTAIKPGSRVYIDKEYHVYGSIVEEEPAPVLDGQLPVFFQQVKDSRPEQYVALYADEEVPYGKIVEILDLGSRCGLKIVLATKPASSPYSTVKTQDNQSTANQ